MAYEKVIIAESIGLLNEFKKPITFLGIMKHGMYGTEWTDSRREVTLAFGKGTKDNLFYIGEIKNTGAEWKWVWAIPVTDIHGYDDLVKHITDKEKEVS